ncbi:hypothetical protein ACUJ46_02580 [Sandaracinobacteroides sp. A072]|uniref:hypothetical protein n=1 Tax=Sandaracinobacteroides sp. A072 TaxID=3461146 RepID=UPI004041B5D9
MGRPSGDGKAIVGQTPWHLWLVGLVALVWNGFGVADYLQSRLRGEAYLRDYGLSQAQIDYMLSTPWWLTALWAIGVWGGLLGAVMLLMRRQLALALFLASLAAYLVSLLHHHVLPDGRAVLGGIGAMQWAVLAGCLVFAAYAWVMKAQRVLR